MPTFYDQLKEAQLENRTSTPGTLSSFLLWGRTDTGKINYYDPLAATVRILSVGTSGGGGGALIWMPDEAGLAAVDAIEYAQRVWKFALNQGQKIYTVVKVPNGYTAGDALTMRLNIYSPDTSGTVLMQGLATLIRTGTDGFSSTANQRTTTNSAVTFSGTADVPRAVSLDITSATGTINSVAVSAGDLIKVQLSRVSGTSISETRFIESSVEVSS